MRLCIVLPADFTAYEAAEALKAALREQEQLRRARKKDRASRREVDQRRAKGVSR